MERTEINETNAEWYLQEYIKKSGIALDYDKISSIMYQKLILDAKKDQNFVLNLIVEELWKIKNELTMQLNKIGRNLEC